MDLTEFIIDKFLESHTKEDIVIQGVSRKYDIYITVKKKEGENEHIPKVR